MFSSLNFSFLKNSIPVELPSCDPSPSARLSGPDLRGAGDSGLVYFGLGPTGQGAAACVPLKIDFGVATLFLFYEKNKEKTI